MKVTKKYLFELHLQGRLEISKTNRETATKYGVSEKTIDRLNRDIDKYEEEKLKEDNLDPGDMRSGVLQRYMELIKKYDNLLREILDFYYGVGAREVIKEEKLLKHKILVARSASGFIELAKEELGREGIDLKVYGLGVLETPRNRAIRTLKRYDAHKTLP